MSPTVNNFVHDLVAMAKAMEDLPVVQAELESAKAMIDNQSLHIQRLELRLIDRASEADALNANIRKLEAERDDAELRFLEADDKLSGIVRLVKDQASALGLFVQAIEPQPAVTEPTPIETHGDASNIDSVSTGPVEVAKMDPGPASWDAITSPSTAPDASAVSDADVASSTTPGELYHQDTQAADASEVASPSDPIANEAGQSSASAVSGVDHSATAGVSVQPDPTQATVSSSESDSNASLAPEPYKGKRYVDVPYYVTLSQWLLGGGTAESYYATRT